MKNNIFLTSDAATVMHDVVRHFDVDKNRKMLFIETAGETHKGARPWIDNALEALHSLDFEVIVTTITDKTEDEIRKAVADVDVLYVAGGNAFYLLLQAKKIGFAKIVNNFLNSGGTYIGQSAGSIIAGPDIYPTYKPDKKEIAEELDDFTGFNLVDFVIFPHFGLEETKDKFLNFRFKHAYSENYKIILLTDNQYVRVQEDGMYKIEEVIK